MHGADFIIIKRNLESPKTIPITEALAFLIYFRNSGHDVCNYDVLFLAKKLHLKEVSLTVTKERIDIIQTNADLDLFLELFKEHREWFVEPGVMWYTQKKVAENRMPILGQENLDEMIIVID